MSVVVAPAAPRRPWGRALAWLAFLGPFFFASYGFATWATAQRAHVGAIVFDWERAIPFLPWTIVPYWSIDLLYGLSLFTCTDRRELDTHAKRLLTAQIVAVCCFLLFPLTFTFERPAVGGVFGALFQVLGLFDKPFNQAPSLHVALMVILWAQYARKVNGTAWRAILHGSFALIGVSILTSWQHHFIDIPTGALLGFFCMWLWPQSTPSPLASLEPTADPLRHRLARRYALGAIAAAAVALSISGWGLWLLWATTALALVAINYALVGPAGFQKRDGRLSPASVALHAPYLAGAYANVCLRARGHAPWSCVADDVWIGRLPARSELEKAGFAAIVDLTCELPLDPGTRVYTNVPVLDLTVPDRSTLAAAVTAIERRRAAGRVLVCCALGYSRSATAAAAWLVATGRAANAAVAATRIRSIRPQVVLSAAHLGAIAAVLSRTNESVDPIAAESIDA
ncbi:MAG TPA: phosphatase PAP2/dual specificity phosphatase family protein [Casimicrobiaceae bacterium]|nr:phosphatase PAP2/dual specificity phosphatase family protein [Casimicrobiaceae bacterium]